MLNHVLKASAFGATAHHQSESHQQSTNDEVLRHCPYHDQIIAGKSAWNTLVDQWGLLDLEEFTVRHEIAEHQKAVGIIEVRTKENMKMFFTGMARTFTSVMDELKLYKLIFSTHNWSTIWQRARHSNPMQLAMKGFTAYTNAKTLYESGQVSEAGEALIKGIFTEEYAPSGNVEWPALPYSDCHEGEQLSGFLGGLLYGFTGEQNTDNLASCVSSQVSLLADFEDAYDTLQERYNADVEDSVAHMRATLIGLSSLVSDCSAKTQAQVGEVQKFAEEFDLDQIDMIANLRTNKEHVDLMLARMKMQVLVHDYFEQGTSYANVVATLLGQESYLN